MVSRVAKSPVILPASVDARMDGSTLVVKGAKAELTQEIHSSVKLTIDNNTLQFSPVDQSASANALSGTMRSLANNMVIGVSTGFSKKLILKGVGYRAKAQGSKLNLQVGYSHPVDMEMPQGVSVETPSNTEIVLSGADKQLVAQVAANVRSVRPPEPYKGKGIRYENEQIIMKEGKKK